MNSDRSIIGKLDFPHRKMQAECGIAQTLSRAARALHPLAVPLGGVMTGCPPAGLSFANQAARFCNPQADKRSRPPPIVLASFMPKLHNRRVWRLPMMAIAVPPGSPFRGVNRPDGRIAVFGEIDRQQGKSGPLA